METTRQQKISRLLQKELSDIFLHQTKAYLSIFPSERAAEIMDNIHHSAAEIRYELGSRVRHQLRIIPELKFFIDDSLDYLENIDKLLKK